MNCPMHNWFDCYTAEKIKTEFNVDVVGDGWYFRKGDALLITKFEGKNVYWVYAHSGDPRADFAKIATAEVRQNE